MAELNKKIVSKSNLKIIQLNVLSWNNPGRRLWISLYIQNKSPDIVLLNSTSLVPTQQNKNSLSSIKLTNYKTYLTKQDIQNGSAILVKRNLCHNIIPNLSTSSIAVKVLTSTGPVVIFTSYIPPRTNSINSLDFQKNISMNVPVLIAGDFNAIHSFFGLPNRVMNHRGELLYHICKLYNLDFLGPDFNTFHSGNRKGRPDLVLGNKLLGIFNRLITQGPRVGSDHIPIQIELDTKPILINTNFHQLDYRNAKWDSFKAHLAPINPPVLDKHSPDATDNAINDLFNHIQNAAKIHIPTKKYKKIKQNFNSEITVKLIQNYQNYFKNQGQPLPQGLIYITRQLIYENLKIDKDTYWKLLVKAASDCYGDHNAFWKKIRHLRGHDTQEIPYLICNNEKITDLKEQTKVLADTWENTFKTVQNNNPNWTIVNKVTNWINNNRPKTAPYKKANFSRLVIDDPLTSPITPDEVKFCIKRMKKKAPGESKIGYQIIKQLPENIIVYITNIFNASLASGYFPKQFKSAILKLIPKVGKDATIPQNYRPIALLDNIGKMFEKIINSRLRQFLEDNNLYNSQQYGFRQGKSTTHVTNLIHECVKHNNAQGFKTAILSKDVQKAFDTVWHSGLVWKIHHQFKLPMPIKKILTSFLHDRTVKVKHNNYFSHPFTPSAGVPQGSALSPTLYTMYTHDLPKPHYKDSMTFAYADDVTHVVRAKGIKSLLNKVQKETDRVNKWERKWLIKTNPQKSQLAITKTKLTTIQRHPPVTINNNNNPVPIPIKKSTNILGYRTDHNLNGNHHINGLLKKANASYKAIKRFRSAPEHVNLTLFKSIIRPTFEYAPLPSIRSSKCHLDNLQKFQNKVLRHINGTTLLDHITNAFLHDKFKIEEIRGRLMSLAKKQINTILTDNLEHAHNLQTKIASLPQGHTLWQDIMN